MFTYDLTKTGIVLNEAVISDYDWGNEYLEQRYINGESNTVARQMADINRLRPNTNQFNTVFDQITSTLASEGGSALYENSNYRRRSKRSKAT